MLDFLNNVVIYPAHGNISSMLTLIQYMIIKFLWITIRL